MIFVATYLTNNDKFTIQRSSFRHTLCALLASREARGCTDPRGPSLAITPSHHCILYPARWSAMHLLACV